MKILLKNARVVDYKNKLDGKMDILLENEKIIKEQYCVIDRTLSDLINVGNNINTIIFFLSDNK